MRLEGLERHLKAAERHIAVGEICIARQRAVIAQLECQDGHEDLLREATRLLAQFLKIQTMHLADRDRLICELTRAATNRRIAEGQFRIAEQSKLISRLEGSEENIQTARNQLALLEGTQAVMLDHRARLDEMGTESAEEMGRMLAALLSMLRISMADTGAPPNS